MTCTPEIPCTKEYAMNITLDTTNTNNVLTAAGGKLSGVKSTQSVQAAQTTDSTAAADEVQTKKYDTVDFSDEAQQYLSEDDTETEEQTEEAQLISESVDTSSDSDEITSSDLYSYTDEQLSELLAKGDITQLQYNTEMAKRSTDE